MLHPEVVDSDHVFRVAYWHNAVIVDVGGDMDLVHMQRLGRAYRDLLAQNPGGIVSCAFLRAEVPVSSAAARAESARFMKELGDSILRVAMVSEHRGVLMQVITTIIRGINVIARNPKLVLLRSAEEAAQAVAPLVHSKDSTPKTQEALMAAIAHVRRGYENKASKLG